MVKLTGFLAREVDRDCPEENGSLERSLCGECIENGQSLKSKWVLHLCRSWVFWLLRNIISSSPLQVCRSLYSLSPSACQAVDGVPVCYGSSGLCWLLSWNADHQLVPDITTNCRVPLPIKMLFFSARTARFLASCLLFSSMGTLRLKHSRI